jgi:YVTN family beta-propeller protein
MEKVPSTSLSRRSLLLASAGALGCSRNKATGYSGYAFVANRDGRSIAAVDLTHFRVRKQIVLDAEPAAVIAHPAKPRVFVLAPQTGTVYEIDGGSLSVSRRVRTGSRSLGMRLAPAGDALWVASREPAEAVEIPLDSFTPRRRIRLAAPPDDFDISRDSQALFAFTGSHAIAIASLTRGTVERTIDASAEPSIVRFRFDGRQLLAGSHEDRTVTIFDTASGRKVVRLPIPIQPRNFCFDAQGGQLFVTGEGMDGVTIVYPYDTVVAETILAGHAPDGMAATETPAYLMVANPDSNAVTVLDIDTRKLVAVVNVGQEPRQILITPDKQYALVLNHRSGDMAVIRIQSLSARRYKSAPLFTMIPIGEGPVSAAVVPIA